MPGPGFSIRRLGASTAVAWLLVAGQPAPLHAEDADAPDRLAKVQSAFLLNFARYTTWPESSLTSGAPLIVSVVGQPPLLPYLQQIVLDERVSGRPIEIRQLDYVAGRGYARDRFVEALRNSHVVYLDAADDRRVREVLKAVEGADVLTVGTTRGFVDDGGMLELRRRYDRVTFGANLDAILATGVRVSSKVLHLAEWVKGGG